ncbi:alpha-E domain-containing protein [Arenibacterium halophilum]|uniref:Alpha-E domain-containing protein n=1 Tax=Arenibacterium halophilum TaxID=2583821 RepID=A0ABY2X719_9RHOB|nr:alpha-E domain-containing protein [Arenibacterium halophilum]TMV11575.1 alpha-E domain-containing protein [Arenibacterium halophilum]
MLGKTAGGLYWMFRYLERAENIARLIEAGFRIALTRSTDAEAEWRSVVTTSGMERAYGEQYDTFSAANVIDFLLRDTANPSSVLSITSNARDNARLVRTALTTEVWEAVNDSWMTLTTLLAEPVRETELPSILNTIRQQSAQVRGALHGTMLRNDIYDFSRIGTFIERADNTARIIDVKYYTLLPSTSFVGSSLDNVQWETVLRSVSAHRAFRWLDESEMTSSAIADFLILDKRLPRSLAFCTSQIVSNLRYVAEDYGNTYECNRKAEKLHSRLMNRDIESIFEEGLHEFIDAFIGDNNALGRQIEEDFRFNG